MVFFPFQGGCNNQPLPVEEPWPVGLEYQQWPMDKPPDRDLRFACLVLEKYHKHIPQMVVKNGDSHGRK